MAQPDTTSSVVPKIKGRERKEVQLLLERGRMQGHLTYDELNEALPPDMVTSDQIDDLMVWLGDLSVQYALQVQSGSFSMTGAENQGRVNAQMTLGR